jgi:hypothetical protein
MKTIIVCLVYIFLTQWVQAQNKLASQTTINNPTEVSIDRAGNIYLATYDGDIIKYDPTLTTTQVFSPPSPNTTTILDAWQGLRIFTFHQELQIYRLINRNLSLHEDYSFPRDLIGFAEIATPTFDNNVWVIDQTDFSLKKLNIIQKRVMSVTPMNLILNPDEYEILHSREYHNRLFLSTRQNGILIFDNFGNYMKNYPFSGINYFNFYGDEIYFLHENKLQAINLYNEEAKSKDLPSGEKWIFALIYEDLNYLFSNRTIAIYK